MTNEPKHCSPELPVVMQLAYQESERLNRDLGVADMLVGIIKARGPFAYFLVAHGVTLKEIRDGGNRQ